MFYLVELLKIMKENVIISFILVISSISLISISHHHSEIGKKLSSAEKNIINPYFNALLSKKINFDTIKRKLSQLPGVVTISQKKSQVIDSEIKRLKSTYGEDLVKNLSAINYTNIKIELEKGLKSKNQTLIREYIVRLIGQENVTLGNLKDNSVTDETIKDSSVTNYISKYWKVYTFTILTTMWLMSLVLLSKPLKRSAFIIMKFQRTKYVYPKMLMGILGILIIPTFAVNLFILPKVDLISLLSVFLLIGLSIIYTLISSTKLKV